MRIAAAQISPTIGDFKGNFEAIKVSYERACVERARLLLTPELSTCGYLPLDLLESPDFLRESEVAIERCRKLTEGKSCALIVGHIAASPYEHGKALINAVTIFENGKAVFTQAKTLLPTYDVFDEARYFEPSREFKLWECDGKKIAVAICEDLWAKDALLSRGGAHASKPLYARDPVDAYKQLGAEVILSLSSSPFQSGKARHRFEIHAEVAKRVGAPLFYVNQMGANDEILFDGGSMVISPKGELVDALPYFEQGFFVKELSETGTGKAFPTLSREEMLYRGLVVGIQDYFRKTGFTKAILGLSGGIDSAVVAVLAAEALGPQNVLGVAMASQYSSHHSLEDADQLAQKLGIRFQVKPIKFQFSNAMRELSEGRTPLADIASQNLQSRLRGITLMTFSNHDGSLVLSTGNKSEIATGYCTLYGDMAGAIAPIGDIYKTEVYALARWINANRGNVIPERTITKAPSAELKPDQKDQDTLPPYEELDVFLKKYLEDLVPIEQSKLTDMEKKVLRMVELSEYKRRQAAPSLRVSAKAFGTGRRIPVAKRMTSL